MRHCYRLEEMVRDRTAELELKQIDLEEMNSVLKMLFDKRIEDKAHMEENIITNIKASSVFPYIEKLRHQRCVRARRHTFLRSNCT